MKKLTLHLSLALTFIILLTSCDNNGPCIRGNNHIQTESIHVSDFVGVELDGAFDVYIKQGSEFELTITGDDNILPDFEARVVNGVCRLDLKEGCYKNYDLHVDITMPNINTLYLDGSGNIELDDFYNQEYLDAQIAGSGNINILDFEDASELFLKIDGSGNITCRNEINDIDNIEAVINGSGNIDAYNAIASEAKATISGSGNIMLTALNKLDVTIDGSGDVKYRGQPIISSNISGSGSLIRVR